MCYSIIVEEPLKSWIRTKQVVVYPGYGVGTVLGFEERTLNQVQKTLVVLSFGEGDGGSIVRIPMDNLGEVRLRPLSPPKAVKEAMANLKAGDAEVLSSWKDRFTQHVQLLSSGDLLSVSRVLKTLWTLNNRKPLSFREKKMYQKALLLLTTEVAWIQGGAREKVEETVLAALRKGAQPGSLK